MEKSKNSFKTIKKRPEESTDLKNQGDNLNTY